MGGVGGGAEEKRSRRQKWQVRVNIHICFSHNCALKPSSFEQIKVAFDNWNVLDNAVYRCIAKIVHTRQHLECEKYSAYVRCVGGP